MTIPTPPTAPNPANPLTFSADATAWVAWWTSAIPLINALSLMTNSGQFTDGTISSPSITFQLGTGVGFYRPAAGQLGIAAGQILIGSSNVISGVGNPRMSLQGANAGGSAFALMCAAASSQSGAVTLSKSRGAAVDDYTIVQTGDNLGNVNFQGADGSTMMLSARVSAQVIGTPASGDVRGQLSFQTGSGANAVATRMIIDDAKIAAKLPVIVQSGGLGYDTGAGQGGAVTQGTSRTTPVTLNKVCGEITMFTAAGSPTPALFNVNCSEMAATDMVILNVKSGATNHYCFTILAKSAGAFTVSFFASLGTATDAPVLSFAIIKASNN